MPSNSDFAAELKKAFLQEAQDQIGVIVSSLLELEKCDSSEASKALVVKVFKQVHNLKGASRAAGFLDTEAVCQALESVFAAARAKSATPTTKQLDLLLRAIGFVEQITFDVEVENREEQLDELIDQLETLSNDLEGTSDKRTVASIGDQLPVEKTEESDSTSDNQKPSRSKQRKQEKTAEHQAMLDIIKLPGQKLDSLLTKAEEFLSIKSMSNQFAETATSICSQIGGWEEKMEENCVSLENLQDRLHDLVQAYPDNQSLREAEDQVYKLLTQQHESITEGTEIKKNLLDLKRAAAEQFRSNAQNVDRFIYEAKRAMMVPCASLLETFPRTVRELSRDLGKEVELVIVGAEIEIDKRLIGLLKDPLLHLVRNALDHGVERPTQRRQAGKAEKAVLTLKISHLDAKTIEIAVADDGGGVDLEKVKEAALKERLVTPQDLQSMNKEQVLALIFASSLSTSSLITDISGRGLGLSIVRDIVSGVGGRITVHSEFGQGAEFKLLVPVTLATFRGMFIDCGEQMFVVPTINFESVFRVPSNEIKIVEGEATVSYDHRRFRVTKLSDILDIQSPVRSERHTNIAILTCNRGVLPVVIDQVLGEQEVLVKPLGPPLEKVQNISGVTMLGSGKVVPVLDVAELFVHSQRIFRSTIGDEEEEQRQKKILVVDDTMAARMLLQNILASAGFLVETASDGGKALAALKAGDFDLLLTDVEMPILTGFELTEAVRGDSRLQDLPVVLITALASRHDRERGIEVGANAYFVKSSFDQENLLEVVNKLL